MVPVINMLPFLLVGEVKVFKHPKASTLYLSIPAKMAQDSEFTIKDGDTVTLEFVKKDKTMVIRRKET